MELSDFIQSTLSQILKGVSAAQTGDLGGNVAAETYGTPAGSNLHNAGRAGMFTVVDFDVAVSASEKDGSGTIKVGSAEAAQGKEKASENTSRIKFAVHLKLPQGSSAPAMHSSTRPLYRPDIG
ncbi:hypothetical protein G3T14_21690 [Methylobacterium sp. BTF04]|uniref:hypothetical protein n=1 Tax=Methylobacterium sp. BTF04 TaxID=2708300 RepID=UPI0013D518EA|nr:hypothetical protein [Methylobacterium sp. BTF04]NEU14695.1 hypothetical protein [Methylobacterium sp. BTF04]